MGESGRHESVCPWSRRRSFYQISTPHQSRGGVEGELLFAHPCDGVIGWHGGPVHVGAQDEVASLVPIQSEDVAVCNKGTPGYEMIFLKVAKKGKKL